MAIQILNLWTILDETEFSRFLRSFHNFGVAVGQLIVEHVDGVRKVSPVGDQTRRGHDPAAVRAGAGPDVKLMCDFNQGLSFGDALRRCRALDDEGFTEVAILAYSAKYASALSTGSSSMMARRASRKTAGR